jgi:Lamin Tail Domain
MLMRGPRFAIATLLAILILAIPSQALAKVEIKRITYNPAGPDDGSKESLNREWVQIHNSGPRAVRIRNWRIRDKSGHIFIFPNIHLIPGQEIRVHTGPGIDRFGDPAHLYWGSSQYIWNNNGDTATLKRRDGTVADRCRYPGGSPGYKVCS